jgi:hypothetical protein
MKLHLPFTLVLLVCFFITSNAQPFIIKGSVSDTINSNALENAAVTLLHATDSVLEGYTRANAEGNFQLKVSKKGKYILMLTFPGFADYVDVVNVKEETGVDVGAIPMVTKTHLLKEFVITQQVAAIKIKGDTTEYMADSFAVRDNATVEALLKKLPGIQVGKDGQIVAQGEKVQKILVDGEEFFSDDPAVVTKSLQANIVEKVQVFDKKSDQAEFTGIDDGEKTKTINLQLKENKKKGYFGKVTAGGGGGDDQNYFENQGMINGFKGKRKLSAFGIMANTGTVGLGWEDREKFTGGGNTEMSDDGGMYTYYSDDDDNFESWDGKYNGEGLPKAWTGGAHYSNKWNEDKHRMSSNYRYANQLIETTGNMLTQYVLPGDSQYFSQQNRDVLTSGDRNKIDGLYEWKIDSSSTIKVTANASFVNTHNRSIYHTETFTGEGNEKNILNYNDRTLTTDATSQSINSTLDWRKKFKKKGRTISLSLTENHKETESNGYLLAQNSTGLGNVDQRKNNNNNTLSLSGRVSYTEPLAKKIFLELNYSAKSDNNSADRNAYNKTTPLSDGYTSLDSIFSSNYEFNVLTNTAGSNLRFVYEKLNFSFGGAVANAAFRQDDLVRDTGYNYHFTNFFPRANIAYNMSKRSKISLSYNGSTNQPTLQQIQPLRDNTDPLNIAVGNPNITQEFNHRFNLSANDYRPLSGRYLWAGAGVSFVNNDISRSENVDSIGRRVYQYINVDGNYNLWGNMWYGYRIAKLNIQTGISLNVNANHVNNFVNGVKNTSDYNTYTGSFEINYDSKDEKMSFSIKPGITYNDNRSTISTLATSFWTSNNEIEASYEFPLKFELGTEINWYIRQQTSIFDQNNDVFKWNAYVSKKFFKNNQLELKAFVNDILNQNIGFNRYGQNNFITENNYNTIRRYGMLSLTWNFTKSPLNANTDTPAGK